MKSYDLVVDDWLGWLLGPGWRRAAGRSARSSYSADGGESKNSEKVGELHVDCLKNWLSVLKVLKVLIVVLDDDLLGGASTSSYRKSGSAPSS